MTRPTLPRPPWDPAPLGPAPAAPARLPRAAPSPRLTPFHLRRPDGRLALCAATLPELVAKAEARFGRPFLGLLASRWSWREVRP